MNQTLEMIDDCGRIISIPKKPKRIVCLVPSLTELLYDVGLYEEVIGVTRYCELPAEKGPHTITIGGTKNPNIQQIKALQPDLIIACKEENRAQDIQHLSEFCPVYVFDINTIEHAQEAILTTGKITDRSQAALTIYNKQQQLLEIFKNAGKNKRVLYLIWRKPWMTIQSNTYLFSALSAWGFKPVIIEKNARYPELDQQELLSIETDLIFLPDEPFPFSMKHVDELQSLGIQAQIELIDGKWFSWYGSHLGKSVEDCIQLIERLDL